MGYWRGTAAAAPQPPRFPVELREADVRRLCTVAAFRWGDKLQRAGHVAGPTLAENQLSGRVQGIWRRVDRVTIRAAAGRMQATCTCEIPFCRHVAALLLAWIREPASFAQLHDGEPEEDALDDEFDELDEYDEPESLRDTGSADEATPESELARQLDTLNMNDLRALARRRGVTSPARTKAELLQLLGRELATSASVDAALAGLTPDELTTLLAADLLTATGGASNAELGEAYGALGGKERYLARDGPPGLATLRELGLVLPGTRNRYEEVVTVPVAVALRLPSSPGLLRPADPARVAEVARARTRPRLSLLEVFLVIERELERGAIGANPPTLRQDQRYRAAPGWQVEPLEQGPAGQTRPPRSIRLIPQPSYVAAEDLARLAELTGQPAEMLDFTLWLMLGAGLIEYAGEPQVIDGAVTMPTLRPRPDRLDAFLALPPEQRLAQLVAAWHYLPDSSEMRLVTGAHHGSQAPLEVHHDTAGYWNELDAPSAAALRRAVSRLVARLPRDMSAGGGWCNYASLIELLHAVAADTLKAPTAYGGKPLWWFTERRHPGQRLNLDQRPDWLRVAGLLAGAILSGPMAWLGLVEVVSTDVQVIAFRARPEAEVLAGRTPSLPPPAENALLRLEMDEQTGFPTAIVPAGSPDPLVHTLLGRFATFAGASPAGLRYQLTPEAAQQAFDLGMDGPEILRILKERSGGQVPAAARATIERWWAGFGRVRLYDFVTLIELAGDVLPAEVLAAAPLQRSLIQEVSPRLLAVDPAAVEEIVSALQRAGHLPRIVEEP